jgi:Fe-Mn family superoxide dismutase
MFTLPDLPYSYDALGKYISKNIMELHHDRHHQTYVDNINKAVDSTPSLKDRTLEDMLADLNGVPEEVRKVVQNHGGGHYNHSLFWKFMSPDGGGQPNGELGDALTSQYGDYQKFVDEFTAKAVSVFGSGWAWLMPDLSIMTTPNQDTPIMNGKPAPIMGLDVWEHAYYLDYTYKRADYIKAWWNIVNWNEAAERFNQYKKTIA